MKQPSPINEPNLAYQTTRTQLAWECGPGKGVIPFGYKEKHVLVYLACRCNSETPDRTFVGIGNIAHHVCASPRSVIRALKNLQAAGLIARKRRSTNYMTSRMTYLNWDLIKERRSPYVQPVATESDEPVTVTNMEQNSTSNPELEAYTAEELEEFQENIISLARRAFAGHNDLSTSGGQHRLANAVNELMEEHDPADVACVLYLIAQDSTDIASRIKDHVFQSTNLGPYIKASMPGWIDQYRTQIDSYHAAEDTDND